jgi:succinate-semialdehyde dehydrogenase/glutarate-semialdehyde dehydrogenase
MAVHNVAPVIEELRSINPSTGELLRTFPVDSDNLLETKLQRAADAFTRWRRTSFIERSRLLLSAAEILEREKRELGRIMTLEMGKPIPPCR